MIVHIIIWLIRIFGSYLDGADGRCNLDWMHFHVVNWLRRDVPIIILYWRVFGSPLKRPVLWGVFALAHLAAHHFFYWIGETLR